MADTAIFKKSKGRASRTRAATPSKDVDDSGDVSASAVAAKLRKQQKERIKPKAKLSFGIDEDGDEDMGEVKKKFNRKLNLGSNMSSSLMTEMIEQAQTPSQSSGVLYSKEYLSELRAETKSAPSRDQSPGVAHDVDLVLDASEMAGAVIVDQDTPMDVVPDIPSEASVVAAKERRERMRQGGGADNEEDFISLDVMRKVDAYQGPHPESRLMREDDDLGEGDDDFAEFTSAKERIALGKKAKKKEAASRRTAMKEMIEDAEEEDEETQEWENAQLRKITRQGSEAPEAAPKREYRPTPIPLPTALPTLDAAMHRLTESMSQLVASHSSNTTSITKLAEERLALETKEKNMREMVVNAESKRSWFSSFSEWVETIAAFLDEKYPTLEKLEAEHLSLIKERRDLVEKRRRRDDMDDLDTVFGETNMSIPMEPQMDEFGRELLSESDPTNRKIRRIERSARHQKHVSQEEEGYSTDASLLDADEADFETAISGLHSRAKDILGDVRSDDFRYPQKGLARWFGNWRERYPDSYEGAFGGLGMLSAWEFWARLEILGWDPISGPRSLDSFVWYSALHSYSRPSSSGADGLEDDESENLGPEGDLAPAMVSTIVPRMCKLIENGAFDPYSLKHLRSVVELSEQVEIYATKEKIDYLFKTIVTQFRQAIDASSDILQPYLNSGNTTKFDPEAIPARKRYLLRRFKLLSVLCRWRKHTGEKFGIGELISKLLQLCMQPVAHGGLEVGGQEIMQKVANVLPPELRSNLRNGI